MSTSGRPWGHWWPGEFFFWLRQELKESQCSFVRLSGLSLSRALNLHLSGTDLLQEHSETIQGALRGHKESTKRE